MKKLNLLVFSFTILLTSCGGSSDFQQLVYENNPHYSMGYAEYFGDYYITENGNKNNVLSISLFSDSLKINELGNLTGLGQYLFLEDVFQAPTDILLQPGKYIVSNSGLPFTVAPGINDTIDGEVYPLGATISYFEYNAANSKLKLISSGSFTVTLPNDSIYTISCDFKTSDSLSLKGSFSALLPHINQSLIRQKSRLRSRLVYLKK